MESLERKLGYLKGILDGTQNIAEDAPKLFSGMLEILTAVAEKNAALDEMFAELNDYVESIDDDLTDLESAQGARGDYEDYGYQPQPLHLVHNAPQDEELCGCVCPKCRFIFFIDGPDGDKYVCPNCEAAVAPEKLTQDNIPMARKA